MSFLKPLEVVALSLYQAGSYNPQFRRHLQMSVNGHDAMLYDEATRGGIDVNSTTIAEVANSIITISATPERTLHNLDGSVHIPNGWGENRSRFILELCERTAPNAVTRHFYIGYCDHTGYIDQGTRDALIDRQLQFYVNSVISIVENDAIVNGVLTKVSRVARSDQYLIGQFGKNVVVGFNDYSIRPVDLVDHMGAASVMNGVGEIAYITNAGAAFGATKIKPSQAAHSRPNRFITRVLESYSKAINEQAAGYLHEEEVMNTTRGYCADSQLNSEPIIRLVDAEMLKNVGYFTFGSMEYYVPHLEQLTKIFEYEGTGILGASQAGLTAHMHGSNVETHATAILGASLPSLMMECLFRSISFRVSNYGNVGEVALALVPNPILPGETMPRPSVSTITPHANIEMSMNRFQEKFIAEIFRPLSANFVNLIDMVVMANIAGDIRVSISVNGGARYDFQNPCFCDSLTSSLITNNLTQLDTMASDFFTLSNHAGNMVQEREQHALTQPLTWESQSDPFAVHGSSRAAPNVRAGAPQPNLVVNPQSDRWNI